MNITVLAPAFYPTLYPVRYLALSAGRYNIPIWWYGLGRDYHDWFQVQVLELLEEIPKVSTSHVMYVDGSDSIILSDLDEITEKYQMLYAPDILISREQDGINAGGWIAEKSAILAALNILRLMDMDTRNPQLRWRALAEEGEIEISVDHQSDIFQVTGVPLIISLGRMCNPATNRYPSVLHFAGGYSSHQNGKAALIEPIWKQLGYTD